MSFQPGNMIYTQGMGSAPENVEVPFIASRAPTTTDINFPIGKEWIYGSGNEAYVLTSFSVSAGITTANWQGLGGGTAGLSQLTGDSGTATPTGASIKLAGTANQISTSASGSTVTFSLPSSLVVTTLTATTLNGTTITTNNATAGLTLNGTTISATGSNSNIGITLSPKGTSPITTTGDITETLSGLTQIGFTVNNTNTTAGDSRFRAIVGGTGAGDPYSTYIVTGGSTWTTGVDNSDSDNYKLSASAALGTTDIAIWTTAGAMTNALGLTLTNGNLTFGTAGNKIISTSVGTTTTAGANSFGSVTLVAGTATVSTTAVTASSLIVLWRQSTGATGAAAMGYLVVGTITAATSFVINAADPANSTALIATDVSVVGWMIIN